MAQYEHLICPLCAKGHRSVRLAPGEKAHCTRCDIVIAFGRHWSADAPLAFCAAGLILAIPACLLDFVSAGNLGAERVSTLLTGVGALWNNGMRALAVLVLLCGCLMPIALLGTLAALKAPERMARFVASRGTLSRVAKAMELCAIPEVQVLAVLVALMKLGSVVKVSIGPGFWCYCAMSLTLLLAQRGFDFKAVRVEPAGGAQP